MFAEHLPALAAASLNVAHGQQSAARSASGCSASAARATHEQSMAHVWTKSIDAGCLGTSAAPCFAERLGYSEAGRAFHVEPFVPQRPMRQRRSAPATSKPCPDIAVPAGDATCCSPLGTPAPACVQRSWPTLPLDRWDRGLSVRHRDPEVSRETLGRVGLTGNRRVAREGRSDGILSTRTALSK